MYKKNALAPASTIDYLLFVAVIVVLFIILVRACICYEMNIMRMYLLNCGYHTIDLVFLLLEPEHVECCITFVQVLSIELPLNYVHRHKFRILVAVHIDCYYCCCPSNGFQFTKIVFFFALYLLFTFFFQNHRRVSLNHIFSLDWK